MRQCQKCGSDIREGNSFCGKCGSEYVEASVHTCNPEPTKSNEETSEVVKHEPPKINIIQSSPVSTTSSPDSLNMVTELRILMAILGVAAVGIFLYLFFGVLGVLLP